MKKEVLISVFLGISLLALSQEKPKIEWVSIPAGTFLMGSPDSDANSDADEILHKVKLSAFRMSKYEITFDQYDTFCAATGRQKPDDSGWGRGSRPVVNVSWADAQAFAQWMGCRLPTEAEWEYACRAGTSTVFSTGNALTTEQANHAGNYPFKSNEKSVYHGKPLPVGSYAPNAWGLFDMHGNVWEWCSDWYGEYLVSERTNPKGPSSGTLRVLRGGAWNRYAQRCRSANRGPYNPDSRDDRMGFRVVSTK